MLRSTVLGMALFAAWPALAAPASDPPQIDPAIRQMAAAIARDVSKDGPLAWLRYFDQDRFLMAVDGKLQFDGIASAKAFMEQFAKGVSRLQLTWTDVRVEVLGARSASLAASYRETITDTAGHSMEPSGYFTGVAVKTPAGWKLRIAHWSSIAPGIK
jgi:ketosteroid isomerase-like protein